MVNNYNDNGRFCKLYEIHDDLVNLLNERFGENRRMMFLPRQDTLASLIPLVMMRDELDRTITSILEINEFCGPHKYVDAFNEGKDRNQFDLNKAFSEFKP